jgi:hypothetical protein
MLMLSSLAVIAGQGRYPLLNFSSGGMPEQTPTRYRAVHPVVTLQQPAPWLYNLASTNTSKKVGEYHRVHTSLTDNSAQADKLRSVAVGTTRTHAALIGC